jgi:hypothetical protein
VPVREVAGYDYRRCLVVARWPIEEMLIAYLEVQKNMARENHWHAQLLYSVRHVMGNKEKEPPPAMPSILREIIISE